jgi:hypothetical protein
MSEHRDPTPISDPDFILRVSGQRSLSPFDDACDVDARGHSQLLEEVADMRLNGLTAEKELGGDLGIGPSIHHKPRNLKFPLGERLQTICGGDPAPRTAMRTPSESSELALNLVAARQGAAAIEQNRRRFELAHTPASISTVRQRLARHLV